MEPGVQAHPSREEVCMKEVIMILCIDIRLILVVSGHAVGINILAGRVVSPVLRQHLCRHAPPADPRFLVAGDHVEADHVRRG